MDIEKSEVETRCDRCNRRLKRAFWLETDNSRTAYGPTCFKKMTAIIKSLDESARKVHKI